MIQLFDKIFGKPKLQKLLSNTLSQNVALISAQKLHIQASKFVLLDTRSREEFDVSHIKQAHWVSENPDSASLQKLIPLCETPLVVYCSLGIRSDKVAQSLSKLGYTKVYNLYGGIFAWKDSGFRIVDRLEEETNHVHVFSKQWSNYLKTGIKIY